MSELKQDSQPDPVEIVGFETSVEMRDGKLVPVITLIPRWHFEARRQKPSHEQAQSSPLRPE